MMKFVLDGEVPAKKNSRMTLRGGKSIPSERFRAWHDCALFLLSRQVMSQCETPPRLSSPLRVWVSFHHADRRRRDGDNSLSSVLDLLVDAGVLSDDSWEIVREVRVDNDLAPSGEAWCSIEVSTFSEIAARGCDALG